jgi:lipopolysaccharide export system protein LptA
MNFPFQPSIAVFSAPRVARVWVRLHRISRQGVAACLGFALLGLSVSAQAERADRNQPMNAEADALRYEDARQLSVFTGNVVITKGSIVIRGDRVEVRQDPQGNQFGLVTGSPASPAFFRQKREGVDEYIEGVANQIDYNGQTDQVKFIGSAVLRRYRGAVLGDETAGSLIVYNNSSETFSVDGGTANRTAANPSGRVRAMLTPASAMETQPGTGPNGASAVPGKPAATAPATPAALKPTVRLDGVGR